MKRFALALAALGLTAVATPAAHAASLNYDSAGAMVLTAAPGESNHVMIYPAGDGSANVDVSDYQPITAPADKCEALTPDLLRCAIPTTVRVSLGDGTDSWSPDRSLAFSAPAQVDGGEGDDDLRGTNGNDTLIGGPGNDKLSGYDGDDRLEGGDGDDTVVGGIDEDTVLGGAGTDNVAGDGFEDAYADFVDGGPGLDTIDGDWSSRRYDAVVTPLNVTLAGGADDGRSGGGEGDDIRGVERIHENMPGVYVGTDAPEEFVVRQITTPVTMRGNGGNDILKTGDGADTIDGGVGDDAIDAGFGDDTIVGGPGRDRISADTAGGDCGPLWCKYPYGNDQIDARDGEVDSIVCGFGTDAVSADAVDIVDKDCETVTRGPVSAPAPGPTAGPNRPTLAPSIVKVRLSRALAHGLTVHVTAPEAGRFSATATAKGRTVARGSRTVKKAGATTVLVRFSKRTRAKLRRQRSVKLSVAIAFTPKRGATVAQTLRATLR
jgi:hemolysin type calcium-binding protein